MREIEWHEFNTRPLHLQRLKSSALLLEKGNTLAGKSEQISSNRKSNRKPTEKFPILSSQQQEQQTVSLCLGLFTHQSSTLVLELITKSTTSPLVSSCQTNRDPEALGCNVYQTNSYVTEDKARKTTASYNNYEKLARSYSRFAEKPERNHQKRRPSGQKAQAKWVKKRKTRLGTM